MPNSQQSLFDTPAVERFSLAGGELVLLRDWLSPAADVYYGQLLRRVQWEQSLIRMAGKAVPIPRLNAWYGEPGTSYRYSGKRFEPLPWNRPLAALRRRVQITVDGMRANYPSLAAFTVNSALVNRYRDGRDSVAWHADDEPELGPRPQIASVSLGEARRFLLRPRARDRQREDTLRLVLPHGSLLLMLGDLQQHWQHCLPKTQRPVAGRVNVTFRQIQVV